MTHGGDGLGHNLHLNDPDELKRPPTVPSSTSYINHSRDLWSAPFPMSPLSTQFTFKGSDNSDASFSVEVKCVQALGEYFSSPALIFGLIPLPD